MVLKGYIIRLPGTKSLKLHRYEETTVRRFNPQIRPLNQKRAVQKRRPLLYSLWRI